MNYKMIELVVYLALAFFTLPSLVILFIRKLTNKQISSKFAQITLGLFLGTLSGYLFVPFPAFALIGGFWIMLIIASFVGLLVLIFMYIKTAKKYPIFASLFILLFLYQMIRTFLETYLIFTKYY